MRLLPFRKAVTIVGTRNQQTRDEWITRALSQIPRGNRILDAGAGEQRYRNLCCHLAYVSQDFGEYDGGGDASGFQMGSWSTSAIDLFCDIAAIPEADGSFDVILCTEVLEHVPDPVSALRELARLLRTGGTLILTAPFCSLTHFSPYFFSTGFSSYYWRHHLERLGFEIVEIASNGNYFEYLAQELHRVEEMAGRYAGTPLTKLERFALRIALGMLQRLSDADRDSSEVLSFGLHVLATKRRGSSTE